GFGRLWGSACDVAGAGGAAVTPLNQSAHRPGSASGQSGLAAVSQVPSVTRRSRVASYQPARPPCIAPPVASGCHVGEGVRDRAQESLADAPLPRVPREISKRSRPGSNTAIASARGGGRVPDGARILHS